MYRVTFKAKDQGRWISQSVIVKADNREDAIKKSDRWPKLIIKVEYIRPYDPDLSLTLP